MGQSSWIVVVACMVVEPAVTVAQPADAGVAPSPEPPAAADPAPAPLPVTAETAGPADPVVGTTDDDERREKQAKKEAKQSAKMARKAKDKWKPRVSGFMQAYYRHTVFTSTDGMVDAPNFRMQRVRIAVDGKVNRWLGYDVSIDPRAPEVAGVLRDAYLTIKHVVPHHKIRIGQQKTLFGYENVESSKRLFAVNRTEVSDNLSRGATLRDVGIGLLGGWPLAPDIELEDAITVVNGNGINTQIDDTRRKSVWGRVGARYKTDGIMIRAGASGARGDYIEPADPLDPVPAAVHIAYVRVGGDVEVDTPWVFVAAEFVWGRDKLPTETADAQGYYVNVVGKTPIPVGPIVRYDVMGDEFQRYTFGAYYGAAEDRFRVLLNYEYRRLKDSVRGDDRLFLWTQVTF